MAGSTNLQQILNEIELSCDGVQYGFASVLPSEARDTSAVIGFFQESEGLALIADCTYLQSQSFQFEGPFAKLTISVHTSLDLVGLMPLWLPS